MPPPSRLLLKGGRVLHLDGDPHHPPKADLLIVDGRIAAVGVIPADHDTPALETIELGGKLIVPGFVNAHYHSHDIFLKGCFDPAILEFWALNALPRAYPPRCNEEIRLRTLLGAVECIRGGITTVQDMLTLYPLTAEQVGVVKGAYESAGLRAILGLQVADVSPIETVPYWREIIPTELQETIMGGPPIVGPDPIAVMDEVFSQRDPASLVGWAVSPSSPERCSRALLERLADVADRFELPVYMHIYISRAEALTARRLFGKYGGSMINYLDSAGLLGSKLTLAHGVWLDQHEIERIASAGSSVVLNLLSNLKTKNGVAPVRQMLAAGINLALGCDNCSCSDAQNIFQAMKLYTYLAAVSDPVEGPPDAVDALRAATTAGARTAGLQNEIGSLRPGMRADLVVIDTADPVYLPLNSAARQIVYGEGGRAVTTVIIDGRVVMRDRVIQTVNETELREALARITPAFRADADKVFARTARLRPFVIEADKRIWTHDIGIDRYLSR